MKLFLKPVGTTKIDEEPVTSEYTIEKLRPVTYQFDTRKFDEHLMQNMPDSIQQQRLAGRIIRKAAPSCRRAS